MGAVVSASNSFVGSSAGDGVGSISGTSVTGGYMFRMPEWNGARGAMMWINMATGATPSGAFNGVVGEANSIVGGTAGDRFGSNVQTLSSNHFLVLSPDWDDAAQGLQDVGAVTWINRNGTLANGSVAGTLS
ncbi:MAG TPA: hypothetical protein PLW24_11005, partial [Burkholderiaceae bacterium]|nr:hypothetical protein [Burkholderiaceae bacterium]